MYRYHDDQDLSTLARGNPFSGITVTYDIYCGALCGGDAKRWPATAYAQIVMLVNLKYLSEWPNRFTRHKIEHCVVLSTPPPPPHALYHSISLSISLSHSLLRLRIVLFRERCSALVFPIGDVAMNVFKKKKIFLKEFLYL